MKPLLVGELNPYGDDDRFALYPDPDHASGARLMRIFNMVPREYLATFDRTNLCARRWDKTAAREAAERIMRERHVIVACGSKVATAFVGKFVAYEITYCGQYRAGGGNLIVTIPHPSGLNRLWNDPTAAARARAAVEMATGLLLRRVDIEDTAPGGLQGARS